MSSGRCETQSSPAHAGRRSSPTKAGDFNRRGRARRSIRQTRTPLRRSRQAALNHPSETERLLCRRQSAARANPTSCRPGPEAPASTGRETKHSAASDQFCIPARRMSLATGPKTNSPQRAAAARRERRPSGPAASASPGTRVGSSAVDDLETSAFRRPCAAGPAIPMTTFRWFWPGRFRSESSRSIRCPPPLGSECRRPQSALVEGRGWPLIDGVRDINCARRDRMRAAPGRDLGQGHAP